MIVSQETLPISGKDLVSFVLDNPSYDEDKPIYIDALDATRSYSNRQARSAVRRLVAGFSALGLRKGDCVLINSMADIDYSILFHGIIASGGIFSGTNPYFMPHELALQIRKTNARFIFTEEEFLPKILSAAKEGGVPRENIFIFNHRQPAPTSGQFRSWRDLMQNGESDWVRFDDEQIARKTIAAYVMSSGTTGLPKAIIISHYNFVSAQTLAFDAERKKFEVRRLLCLPQFATAAIYSNHVCPLRGGEIAYVMPRFNATSFLDNIEKFQISELTLMPPMIIQLLQHPRISEEKLRSVRYVHGGGAAIGKALQAAMKKYLRSDTPFTQIWGMSETSGHAMCLFWPEDDDTGSIGRLIPNLSAKLIDDDGNEVNDYDTRGELCIKGPTLMVGYLNSPEANAGTFDSDGWLKTGDICYCDGRTKKWYIVDRKKELIKVRGFQVAPPELEELLLQHDGIADAAVVGANFPLLATELPVAFVVRRPGSKHLSEGDVKSYVEGRVTKYKRLEGGVFFVDNIPKTASGKILKGSLRDRAKREGRARMEKL